MRFLSGKIKFLLAVSTLAGTIIGVGMFGLPYAASRAGLGWFFIYLAILGAAVTLIHLVYGEIVLRTKEKHRMAGYARIYLGRFGELAAVIVFFVTMYLALLAYLLIGGEFLKIIFSGWLGFSTLQWSLIFAFISYAIIFKGIKFASFFEFLMTGALAAMLVVISLYCFKFARLENFSFFPSQSSWFLPYGIILFALAGGSAIPEIKAIFSGRESRDSKSSIITGTLIPVFVYGIFTAAVLGVCGLSVSAEAIKGLEPFLGEGIARYGAIIGFLAVITSFLTIGLNVKNSFRFDFKLSNSLSFVLMSVIPLALLFFGWNDFINIISFSGAVLGGMEGIILLAIWRRAIKKGDRVPEYSLKLPFGLLWFLASVFAAGILYEILYFG